MVAKLTTVQELHELREVEAELDISVGLGVGYLEQWENTGDESLEELEMALQVLALLAMVRHVE